jgi:DNA repair ATPase RecN
MSLNRIEIRNFQSLRKVDLELGAFTVIVGASSSGKSALMRAFRAVASNVRGGDVITRGQKSMAITVYPDNAVITLERTPTSGTYRLRDSAGQEFVFTKLNGGVPPQVSRALRIEPCTSAGSSVNFASQFDRPYLLDATGANVAHALGELTNVSTIFAAVRAANRHQKNASSLLRTRKADRDQVEVRLGAYQRLSERQEALRRAEQLHAEALRMHERLDQLRAWHDALAAGMQRQRELNRMNVAPPDPAGLNALNNRLLELIAAVRAYQAKAQRLHQATQQAGVTDTELTRARTQLTQLLESAGMCPTCGQSTVSS